MRKECNIMTEEILEMVKLIRKAMMEDNIEYIQEFFDNNQDKLNIDTLSGTWLYNAVNLGKMDIIKYLISKGVDINNGGVNKYTPLNEAVFNERIDIVKMLLDNGAHIDTSDISRNPLIIAINTKNPEIVKFLLEQKMDIAAKYQLSYGEVDALRYAKYWSTQEIVSLVESKYAELGIPIVEQGNLQTIQKKQNSSEKKLDKRVLREKLDFAVRQMVREYRNKLQEKREELYAMCFRMHCDAEDAKWRYMCEIIVQTKEGYEKSMNEYEEILKKNGEKYDSSYILAFKYIPEEYKYTEFGLDGFKKVREYLFENCFDLDECEELEIDEEEKLYKRIQMQNKEIEKNLVDVIAKLRKEKFLIDYKGKEFYVFPYIGEDDLLKEHLPNVKKMNKGLDIMEYIEFIKSISHE